MTHSKLQSNMATGMGPVGEIESAVSADLNEIRQPMVYKPIVALTAGIVATSLYYQPDISYYNVAVRATMGALAGMLSLNVPTQHDMGGNLTPVVQAGMYYGLSLVGRRLGFNVSDTMLQREALGGLASGFAYSYYTQQSACSCQ